MSSSNNILEIFISFVVGFVASVLANEMSRKISKNKAFYKISIALLLIFAITLLCYLLFPGVFIRLPLWGVMFLSLILFNLLIQIHQSIAKGKYKIIENGMIGFMEKCIEMESRVKKHRLVLYKHIPSYMRDTTLNEPDSSEIRRDWDVKGEGDYRDLTNKRSKLIKDIVDRENLPVREIYEKKVLEKWAETGLMFTGANPNPKKERLKRLNELLRLITEYKADHYDIKITNNSLYFPLLICDDELVIDVGRQAKKLFKGNLGGLYCKDKKIVEAFTQFFQDIWRSIDKPEEQDRDKIKKWLDDLIKKVKEIDG